MRARGVLSVLAAVLIGGPGIAAAQAPSQAIRFVEDVVGQFNSLAQRPDAMGFELHGPDPSQCRHMQGVLRVDAADGTPYLLVSRSGVDTGWRCGSGSDKSNIYIVKMGSRDKHGERMRSNRLRKGMQTTDTPPDTRDLPIRSLLFDGTTEWPHYGHPGGMQQVGDIVALALEEGLSGQPKTKILFMNVRDPENPEMLKNSFDPPTDKAGIVAITPCGTGRQGMPCETGHYLMLITGGHNEELLFFESTGSDLTSLDLKWNRIYQWHKDELVGADWPDNHQTLHFIRQGNAGGALFLAGARSDGTVDGLYGDDYIDLYEVRFVGDKIELEQRSTRHMISHPTGEGVFDPNSKEVLYGSRLASFAAASGFHITPSGELLFYATEHDNDGPEGSNERASVKFGEWRHLDMFRPGSPALLPDLRTPASVTLNEGSAVPLTATAAPPIAQPWIEFFEYFGYGGRFVVMDLADRFKDDFHDFGLLDKGTPNDEVRFNNTAASWRWFAPDSCAIRANDLPFDEPNFPGPRTKTLVGTGVRQFDRNLQEVLTDDATEDMLQVVSSGDFALSCANYYATTLSVRWDLDFDGTKETTGNNVTLSAADLDGPSPSTLALDVETRHPADGLVTTKQIPVTVLNVNPVVGGWTLLDAAGRRIGVDVPFALQNRPVRAQATFTDAGRVDHQSAAIEWGDGSTSQSFLEFVDAFGGVQGHLAAQHPYSIASTYSVRVAVTDDDGGVGAATAPLTVKAPADAVKDAIALLDALIATTSGPARTYLLAARSSLVGAGRAGSASGALTKIDKDLVAAAIAQLRNAKRHLSKASNVAGVAVIEAVLEEVIAALSL